MLREFPGKGGTYRQHLQ